ncbi:MAG: diaminopimelate decarboxylase [Abditibacteriales bacterium]|nr:diaminopimelate decarboxylase [Abditibacteriales bacterium]
MFFLGTQKVNAQGHLEIGGCDCVELARKFGTPLYVLDEALIRRNCRDYRAAFERRYPHVEIIYATKACLTTALCRIMQQEGLSLDTASAGELFTALKAEFPAEKIYLHGNFKSTRELEMALSARVGRIVVDSELELEQLNALAARRGQVADILLRVTPAVDPHTHEYIQTGKVDTKFGLGIGTGAAMQGVKRALSLKHLRLHGFHSHIGSQILDVHFFEMGAELLVAFIKAVAEATGFEAKELNVGGGLGIKYVSEHKPPTKEEFAEALVGAVKRACAKYRVALPKLMLEPGRSIIGDAGITLYTVGPIKDINGVRTYVSVDGGLSDNPRPALYQARYSLILANRPLDDEKQVVTVVGKHCESDMLFENVTLPKLQPGDILAVQSTGAYNFSMSSNYNRFPRPAVVLVHDGRAELIVRRQTLEDLIAQDIIPERLR